MTSHDAHFSLALSLSLPPSLPASLPPSISPSLSLRLSGSLAVGGLVASATFLARYRAKGLMPYVNCYPPIT